MEDGAQGPVLPTEGELAEIAVALRLSLTDVLGATRTPAKMTA